MALPTFSTGWESLGQTRAGIEQGILCGEAVFPQVILRHFTFGHHMVGLLKCSAPRGLEDRAFQRLVDGIVYGMVLLYIGQSTPVFPLTDHTPTKHRRNEEIRARYAVGETVGYRMRSGGKQGMVLRLVSG
jgi:hypothetical protein